jgi:HSF-type DNA-binding
MSAIVAPSLGMLLQVVPCSINIDMDQISNPEMLLHPSDASNEKPEEISLEDKPEATIPEMLRPSSETPDESPASLVVDAAACAKPLNTLKKSMCKEGSDDDDENPNDIRMDDVPENDDAANQNSPFRMSSGLLPFPDKLMSLLDSNKVSEAMRWLRDGDAFCIAPGLFTERVLDKYFQGTKFESFTRKLNRWCVVQSNLGALLLYVTPLTVSSIVL